jgi:hypothetical protein
MQVKHVRCGLVLLRLGQGFGPPITGLLLL